MVLVAFGCAAFVICVRIKCSKPAQFVHGVNTPWRPQAEMVIVAPMNLERNTDGEPNKRGREFYRSLIIGVLAFLVAFVVLRWVWH